ncbi:MAG TPA: undecaprenyl-diphosphatase, partial [Sediminispirochaeta sp.]|nr:undecaprenyl-diphosphatase [Sediminispirochaeta sp.]
EKAGEYSFLISIPAILGALLLKLKEMDSLLAGMGGLEIVVGFSFSFLSGLFSLLLLLKLVRRGRLSYFSFYLVPLGLLGLFFL